MQASKSLNQKAYERLKRNRAAMFGLWVIGISFFVAIFAYKIAPDNTPNADDQILELGMQNPGFRMQLLQQMKTNSVWSETPFTDFFFGKKSPYISTPILKYRMKQDFMYATVFKGENFPPEEKKYLYQDILKRDSIHFENKVFSNETFFADTLLSRKYFAQIHDGIWKNSIVSKTYFLGTDRFGRDILSRLIIGIRVSLFVGLVAVLISLVIGIFLGALAGYFRGWVDDVIMWVVNVFWSIPTLLLAMGLYVGAGTFIESKLVLIFIAVGLTMWVEVARMVRGQFILVREFEFVTAAQSLGYSHFRTVFKHILPNVLGPIIVVACANFAGAILIESGLSYIGLGIQPPAPSWGGMLSEYKDYIDSDKAYLAIWPGVCIMVLVLAFNLLGNGLRDALDVKGKSN